MEAITAQLAVLQRRYEEQGIGLKTALDLLEKANDKMTDYRKTIKDLQDELKNHAK